LGDASVSLFSGEVKLKDFLLGNPPGFQSPQAMKVGSIYVNVDEKSLTGNPIVIDQIEVVAPEITYERSGQGGQFQGPAAQCEEAHRRRAIRRRCFENSRDRRQRR
jgi:uncharacterized protein involved in outer membrane biogenesis